MRHVWSLKTASVLAALAITCGSARLRAGEESPATGGAQESKSAKIFAKLDKNSDGKVTKDEVPEDRQAFLDRLVQRGDKDGDGALTREEFVQAAEEPTKDEGADRPDAGRGPRPEGKARRGQVPVPGGPRSEGKGPAGPEHGPRGGLFSALDADHDGKLTAEELSKGAEVINKLDRDGDKAISLREAMPGPPPGAGRPGGEPGGPAAKAAPGAGGPKRGGVLEHFDQNKDGKLSKDEAPDRLKEQFEKVDANSDGQLDREELRKHFEQVRGDFQKRAGEKRQNAGSEQKKEGN